MLETGVEEDEENVVELDEEERLDEIEVVAVKDEVVAFCETDAR